LRANVKTNSFEDLERIQELPLSEGEFLYA
jgi:hypothetical protein